MNLGQNRTEIGAPAENTARQSKLSGKQLKVIPKVLAGRTYQEGCKAAGVSRATFYGWLQDETFRTEFERQRGELAETAFGMIAQNIEKAVSVLMALLDTKDDRVRRLVANDVIGHFLKHRELKEFEERLAAIEARLGTGR